MANLRFAHYAVPTFLDVDLRPQTCDTVKALYFRVHHTPWMWLKGSTNVWECCRGHWKVSLCVEVPLQIMTGYWVTQAIYVAAKLGIADLLEKAPLNCDELANRTESDALSLYRTLRALASVGVFSEVAPREFALTPLAALLRTNAPNSMRSLAIMYAEEQYRAWGEMLYSVRTGQPALEQFGMGVFEYFAQNPAAGTVFNEAMSGLTSQTADALAKAYNFSAFKTIVDVGGNIRNDAYGDLARISIDSRHFVRPAKCCRDRCRTSCKGGT